MPRSRGEGAGEGVPQLLLLVTTRESHTGGGRILRRGRDSQCVTGNIDSEGGRGQGLGGGGGGGGKDFRLQDRESSVLGCGSKGAADSPFSLR